MITVNVKRTKDQIEQVRYNIYELKEALNHLDIDGLDFTSNTSNTIAYDPSKKKFVVVNNSHQLEGLKYILPPTDFSRSVDNDNKISNDFVKKRYENSIRRLEKLYLNHDTIQKIDTYKEYREYFRIEYFLKEWKFIDSISTLFLPNIVSIAIDALEYSGWISRLADKLYDLRDDNSISLYNDQVALFWEYEIDNIDELRFLTVSQSLNRIINRSNVNPEYDNKSDLYVPLNLQYIEYDLIKIFEDKNSSIKEELHDLLKEHLKGEIETSLSTGYSYYV